MKPKRLAAFLTAAAAALSFAACGQQTSSADSSQELQSANSTVTLRELDHKSEDGIYYLERVQDKGLLCFIDYAGKKEVPLCSEPNCSHSSEECSAWAGKGHMGRVVTHGPFVLDENTLLYQCYCQFDTKEDSNGKSSWDELWLMDADGTNPRLFFKGTHTQSVAPPFYTDGTGIYCSISEMDIDENDTLQNTTEKIVRLDLNDARQQVVWEPKNSSICLGVDQQGRLLLCETDGSGNGMYEQVVYAVDFASMQKTELARREFSKQEDVTIEKLGERVYWWQKRGAELCWVDSSANKAQVEIQWPQEIAGANYYCVRLMDMIGEALRVRVDGPWERSSRDFLVNPETGAVQPLTLEMIYLGEMQPVQVHTDTPQGLLVTFESWPEARPGEADKRMGFISKEDFIAGNRCFEEIDRTAVR